jgi:hypothetical protein
VDARPIEPSRKALTVDRWIDPHRIAVPALALPRESDKKQAIPLITRRGPRRSRACEPWHTIIERLSAARRILAAFFPTAAILRQFAK